MNSDSGDFKYRDLTDRVYNRLGYGFLEKVYENAMMFEFRKEGIPATAQYPIKVFYEGNTIGEYNADIFVDNKIIIELKASRNLAEENEAQLLNYLKATNVEVGLLMNFGTRPEIKRKAFDKARKQTARWDADERRFTG